MASSIFPTKDSGVFNPAFWSSSPVSITQEYADLHYLKFPIGQGIESVPGIEFSYSTPPTHTSTELGYSVNIKNTSALSFTSSGVAQTIGSTTLSVGVYQFSGYIIGSGGTSTTGASISFNTTNNVNGFGNGTGIIGSANPSSTYNGVSFTCIFTVTTSAIYYFCASFQGMSSAVSVPIGYANGTVVRIAKFLK
jgi:hypothetical protein